jgi:hypothetical protein
MSSDPIFLNGVYEAVLKQILKVQEVLPEQIMFLQPHKSVAIARLRDHPPSVEAPVPLLMSVTTDLPTIHYTAEIVGWDDKRDISEDRRRVLNRLIQTLQSDEGGLYDASLAPEGESVNLLHVRRLRRITAPFSVAQLVNVTDDQPVSDKRATSGGWIYVRQEGLSRLIA